jgi:rare lipoprotein A
VVVRINDRGPYAKKRIIDLSYAAGKKIGLIGPGTAKVKIAAIP